MNDILDFLEGSGQAVREIREFAWQETPLGPIHTWPASLRIAVGMMLASRFPKAITWGPEFITFHNDAFRPILGDKPPAIGRSFRDVWAEAWDEIRVIAERAYAGEATFIENFPLVVHRYGYPEQAYFTFCYSPIRDETGAVAGMMDTVIEVTETVVAQRQLAAVNAELAHRMRNMIAMISALVGQSLRGAGDLESAREVVQQRLSTLGQAQALLTEHAHAAADISNVIDMVFAPVGIDRGRVAMMGPTVWLKDRLALSLSLALNELATNAVKYGAFSAPTGRVEIVWSLDDDPGGEFRFTWRETGGPPVEPPTRSGFGSRLIEQFVAADFGGTAALSFDPEGVRYEIVTSAKALV